MESFRGFDHKYKYKIGGHSGDSEKLEFVKEGTCVGSLWVVLWQHGQYRSDHEHARTCSLDSRRRDVLKSFV